MKKAISESKVQRMRNLVMGNHNAKTKVQSGYVTSTVEHSEGDVWTEGGKEWTIKNGIKQTVNKLNSIRKLLFMPLTCPECNSRMRGEIDKASWNINKKCHTCVEKEESKLKTKNLTEVRAYEKEVVSRIKKDGEIWLKDVTSEFEDFISADVKNQYVTEAGTIEDWSGGKSKTQQRQEFDKKIAKAKKNIEE
tara:strand:+ start:2111 stop:2689 length:579 start_codon:yes stop_codon:yes gene_type:complete